MGCTNKTRSNAPRVRIGTDTIFSVALYRHDGGIGVGQTPDSADVVSPSELASIEAEIRNEFGVSEGVVVKMEGKAIKLEVTKELTERMGLGQYKLRLKIREADARFADGYRDVTLLTDLCQVVSEGADVGKANADISVAIAQLATGKSAYQHYLETTTDNPKKSETEWLASLTGKSAYQSYLDTTKDVPKMTEEEWASNGWLIMLETLKKLRGIKR
jgi:hypothetical protein|nr:MAG TPA: hypothetical protein [Caudoviricetes sp.]